MLHDRCSVTVSCTFAQWHKDNDALPQRLFAALGSMFMYVPQSVRMCAYLCGSVLFEFSLSGAVCWLTCAILHRFAEHILYATSFVCMHAVGSVRYLCVAI